MVLVDSRPILSVSSPIKNITLLYRDQTNPTSPGNSTEPSTNIQKANASSLCKSPSEVNYRRKTKSLAASEKPQTIHEHAKRNQRKLIEETGSHSALSFMYKHQLDIPALFIIAVLIGHYSLRIPIAETFLFLQNKDVITGLYSKAWTDLNFILFWVVAFTFLRAFVMTVILKPIAIRCGVKGEHQRNRFQEEGWVFVYYSISWTMGMYVLRNSPLWNNWIFWFKPEAIFEGYPHTQLPHQMLWYYYVQLGFWLQQLFVLHIEAPRKDFWALLAHHTVTLLLISGSAISNFWRAGNAVFVVMDLADIILAFSKSIKYLGVPDRICDSSFVLFMVSWLYTRHYLYIYILHGFMFTAYEIIPFELNITEGKWYCRELAWLPILGLGLLQILMFYWFGLILRILFKILRGQSAEDERSDDELEHSNDTK